MAGLSRGTWICVRTFCLERRSPSCRGGLRAWLCARGLWWSIRRRVEVRRTHGYCRTERRGARMLSRVADSLYWMSRYFERADHCARVLEANYNLMLNPSKLSTEERWHRIMVSLGIAAPPNGIDPQLAMLKLTSDPDDESSIVSCIAESRENAGQVREQISSEMWERLNSLYHQVTQANSRLAANADALRLVGAR